MPLTEVESVVAAKVQRPADRAQLFFDLFAGASLRAFVSDTCRDLGMRDGVRGRLKCRRPEGEDGSDLGTFGKGAKKPLSHSRVSSQLSLAD